MFDIERTDKNGVITFSLKGTLDSDTVIKFNKAIDSLSDVGEGINIDCSELQSISGLGFEALARLNKMTKAFGKQCLVMSVPDNIYYIFNVTGLIDTLNIEKIA